MTDARPFTVLVASSDRLVAEAAAEHLRVRHSWDVPAPLGDGLVALTTLARDLPDAVLVVRDLERLRPAAFAGQVARRWPDVTVVFLGGAPLPDGHATSLPWSADGQTIAAALTSRPSRPARVDPDGERVRAVALLRRLTPRERHVLKLLGEGRTLRQIAEQFEVSEHTARTHMQHLYEKLECHNRLDVVLFALRHGVAVAR